MKFPWTIVAVAIVMLATTVTNANTPAGIELSTNRIPKKSISATELAQRLEQINLPFAVQSTSQVKLYVRRYLVEGYRDSEDILGRAHLYFPIFEHYLKLYNLPESLKYLPIVESALRPYVHSPVGAAGLWQFVPATARLYGLTVNGQVDERLDPHKSTEAAVRMLAALYQQFNDWGLVLAAYNCGPGRVKRVMRTYGATDFWSAQAYLPRESQNYVPGFIAAAYLMNYHNAHGISPDYLNADMQLTRTFTVFESLHLATVARELNISYRTLQRLNPSYISGLVHKRSKGQLVTVPERIADAFQQRFLNDSSLPNFLNGRQRSTYVTVAGDNLDTLAQLFECSKDEIISWNKLSNEKVTINQPLVVYLPRRVVVRP